MADEQKRDDAEAINPDHPDRASEPGTGGLMPGSYEQAGGEAGKASRGSGADPGSGPASTPQPATPHIRAPGSKVPDPRAHPEEREAALDIASGRGPAKGGR